MLFMAGSGLPLVSFCFVLELVDDLLIVLDPQLSKAWQGLLNLCMSCPYTNAGTDVERRGEDK